MPRAPSPEVVEVPAEIIHGRVTAVHAEEALAHTGVPAVLHGANRPYLYPTGGDDLAVLQSPSIAHRGRFVVAVVAESRRSPTRRRARSASNTPANRTDSVWTPRATGSNARPTTGPSPPTAPTATWNRPCHTPRCGSRAPTPLPPYRHHAPNRTGRSPTGTTARSWSTTPPKGRRGPVTSSRTSSGSAPTGYASSPVTWGEASVRGLRLAAFPVAGAREPHGAARTPRPATPVVRARGLALTHDRNEEGRR